MRSPEPALALSAIALAFAAGLGVLSFELDLPAYRFGWRQILPPAAALALALGALPILGASFGGRWDQPTRDLGGSLAFVSEGSRLDQGDFRVLWLGDAGAVPGHPWKLGDFGDTSYSLSRNGGPEATELWAGRPPGATTRVGEALSLASGQSTSQLGRMLAPMGIRYVAVARRAAPEGQAAPLSPELVSTLDRQVDLGRIETEDAVILFENAAWIPARAELPGGTLVEGGLVEAASADLSGTATVLPDGNETVPTSFSGDVEVGTRLLLAESPSSGWRLDVEGGAPAPREPAFGVANAWDVESGGAATLSYRSPLWQWGVVAAQIAMWVLAGWWVWKTARERRTERRIAAKAAE